VKNTKKHLRSGDLTVALRRIPVFWDVMLLLALITVKDNDDTILRYARKY
jgi:hypothetical protein